MKHHTQNQSTFTFSLIKTYQPFNQTIILYLQDIHNTQSNHIFTRLYIYSHISHSPQTTGSSSLVVYSKQYRIPV